VFFYLQPSLLLLSLLFLPCLLLVQLLFLLILLLLQCRGLCMRAHSYPRTLKIIHTGSNWVNKFVSILTTSSKQLFILEGPIG
jgi:hypothetical protein